MIFTTLFVLLVGLAGIVAFLIYYNKDDLVGAPPQSYYHDHVLHYHFL